MPCLARASLVALPRPHEWSLGFRVKGFKSLGLGFRVLCISGDVENTALNKLIITLLYALID